MRRVTLAALATLGLLLALGTGAHAATPRVGHVFVVVLENKGFDETFGPGSSKAPYLSQTLTRQGQLLSQYHGIAHLSQPNYIAMISGQAPNLETQSDCQNYTEFAAVPPSLNADGQAMGQGCVYPPFVRTVADQLTEKGLSWKGYMQDMGTPCRHPALNTPDDTQQAEVGDQYAARHNPFVYFHSIIDSPDCAARNVDLGALPGDLQQAASTPALSYIVPNLCDDGHDAPCVDGRPGGLITADEWLREWIPRITGSPAFKQDGLLIVTFDEAEASGGESDASACCNEKPGPNTVNPGGPVQGPGGGRTGSVVLSPFVAPGSVNATPYNHYSLLRTIEDFFGLGHLGFAAQEGLKPFGDDVFAAKSPSSGAAGSPGPGGPSCAASSDFARASATPQGRGLALRAAGRGDASVRVTVHAAARGRRVVTSRTVASFAGARVSRTLRSRRLRDGVYVVRFVVRRAGNTAVRRVAVARRGGRFSSLPAFERSFSCGAVRLLGAARPVFGGTAGTTLRATFGLATAGPATLELLRGDRVVRRLRFKRLSAGTIRRASFGASRARGLYRLRLRAGGATATVAVRRL